MIITKELYIGLINNIEKIDIMIDEIKKANFQRHMSMVSELLSIRENILKIFDICENISPEQLSMTIYFIDYMQCGKNKNSYHPIENKYYIQNAEDLYNVLFVLNKIETVDDLITFSKNKI